MLLLRSMRSVMSSQHQKVSESKKSLLENLAFVLQREWCSQVRCNMSFFKIFWHPSKRKFFMKPVKITNDFLLFSAFFTTMMRLLATFFGITLNSACYTIYWWPFSAVIEPDDLNLDDKKKITANYLTDNK